MRVVVTRAQPQASQWRDALQARLGAQARVCALPLMAIAALQDGAQRQRLQQAWEQLPQCAAVFFVSLPAVQHFFAAVPDAAARWRASGARAWAPGRGTRQALCAAGVEAALIDSPPAQAAQFDSETLWPLVAAQMQGARAAAKCLLRVRGTDAHGSDTDGAGRDWMGAQVAACGVAVRTVVAYRREAPCASDALREQVLQCAVPRSIWLWSSSQALGHLAALLPQQNWSACRAIATHERIAQTAQRMGFGEVLHTRPTLEDVARSIQSRP